MSSPLITTVEVLEAMGQNPDLMEESTPAITSAIIRATLKLESLLKTSLAVESRTDFFYISGADGGPLNKRYTFYLTNGFVIADSLVTVVITDHVDGSVITTNASVVDRRKGIVTIQNYPTDLIDKDVAITYTSGFDGPDDALPEMKQAMLCFVPAMLLSTSTAQVEPKLHQAQQAKANSMDSMGMDMISRMLRSHGAAIKPLYSELLG